MPYTVIEDFRGGLDVRRSAIAGAPGTLVVGTNCVITEGGEVKSRKTFYPAFPLPVGTVGMATTNGQPVVFGSVPEPSDMPAGVQYVQLNHPVFPLATITEIVSYDLFNGQLYVVARFSENSVIHFYNGVVVSAITNIQSVVTGNASVIQRLADLINATTQFVATTPGGVLHVVHSVGGTSFFMDSNTIPHGTPIGATLTMTSRTGTALFTNWCTAAEATIGGPFDGNCDYRVYLQDAAIGFQQLFVVSGLLTIYPNVVKTHRSKMYTSMGASVYFSGINDPYQWYINGVASADQPVGAGFIVAGIQDSLATNINAIGVYQGRMALFGDRSIQIWNMEEEENNNLLIQLINSAGTIAPRSVMEVGGLDTFFADASGFRSLKSRIQSDAAFSSDVGSAIDSIVRAHFRAAGAGAATIALLEPIDGRIWFALGDKIYALSYFPDGKVSAWTILEPGFNVEYMVTAYGRAMVRSGNTIYMYGGWTGDEYPAPDEMTQTIRLPFFSMGKPAHTKSELAIDLGITGTWNAKLLIDPSDPTNGIDMGTFVKSTHDLGRISAGSSATHVAIELTSTEGGETLLSHVIFHYDIGAVI